VTYKVGWYLRQSRQQLLSSEMRVLQAISRALHEGRRGRISEAKFCVPEVRWYNLGFLPSCEYVYTWVYAHYMRSEKVKPIMWRSWFPDQRLANLFPSSYEPRLLTQ